MEVWLGVEGSEQLALRRRCRPLLLLPALLLQQLLRCRQLHRHLILLALQPVFPPLRAHGLATTTGSCSRPGLDIARGAIGLGLGFGNGFLGSLILAPAFDMYRSVHFTSNYIQNSHKHSFKANGDVMFEIF